MLAAAADVRGDRDRADALLRAVPAIDELPLGERRDLLRSARRDVLGEPAWPGPVVDALRGIADKGIAAVIGPELSRLPADVASLLDVPELDPADVIRVHRRHGAVTAADIAAEAAVSDGRGDDDSVDALARIAPWLTAVRERRRRVPLGRALTLTDWLEERLDDTASFGRVQVLGSVRRFEPTVGNIDVMLVHQAPGEALERAIERLAPDEVRHRGTRRAVLYAQGEEVSLRACSPHEAPFASLWHTGTVGHLRQLRRHAAARSLDLGVRHLRDASGTDVACAGEDDIYGALGLSAVPPELRHGEDEVQRAANGPLPRLLEVRDMLGDLHMHTLYSDGRDSVDTMVYAARALGYEYVAITDHSPSAAASRVLTLDRIERQMDDVERARQRIHGITVLYGVEVDILPDGSLDLPEHVLARLDIVLASLHEPAGHGPDRLLSRYLSAVRHPRVNVITHPTNRLIGRDEGYDLDWDVLFTAAIETGTAMEVDGGPGHLDMDGRLARRAVAAGVTVTVDSDCHNALRLGRQMRLGVGTARRGGLEPRHVLNTRPLEDVLAFFAAKRRRLGAA